MHQRVFFSHSVRKKETSKKLSKELYFLNSVKETMFKRNFPKNCVQEKNQRTRVRFKKKRAKLIAETKLAANKEIDRAKNEINENEKRQIDSNEKQPKRLFEIDSNQSSKSTATKSSENDFSKSTAIKCSKSTATRSSSKKDFSKSTAIKAVNRQQRKVAKTTFHQQSKAAR